MSNTKKVNTKLPPLAVTRYQELEDKYNSKCQECDGFRIALNSATSANKLLSGRNINLEADNSYLIKLNKYLSLNLWVRIGMLFGFVDPPRDTRKIVFP